jgi:hypothetical protein
MWRWSEAANDAPIFEGAQILPDVALVLEVVQRLASDADIAIRHRKDPGADLEQLGRQERIALDRLSKIAAVAREVIGYSKKAERSRQARELKKLVADYLAERGPRPDLRAGVELEELARGFVHLLWLHRFAPLTRYLTARRLLVGDDEAATEKVRAAWISRCDGDVEPEKFVRVALRTLGIPARTVKVLFDADRVATEREDGKRPKKGRKAIEGGHDR